MYASSRTPFSRIIVLVITALALSSTAWAQGSSSTETPRARQVFATSTPQPHGESQSQVSVVEEPTAAATIIGPFTYPDGYNPMTGLPYPNAESRARRNLIVKISNHPPIVRPQHGVNAADLVFEYEAEGNVTRFAAVYRTNAPERVGSIRSGRLLDIELITMYSALLAYSGTSEPIRDMYLNSDFRYRLISPSIGDNCDNAGFCRDTSLNERGYEHTLFGNTRRMWEVATRRNVNTGFRAVGLAFSEQMDVGGIAARDIYTSWSGRTDARWQYDEFRKQYLRYTDNVPHYDAADGEQLWADNLVIIEVPHRRRPDLFPPGSKDESLEVALWESGRAYVFRDGFLFVGFWKRLGYRPGEAMQLMFGNSQPIPLRPGRTWITVARTLGNTFVNAELVQLPTATPEPE